MIIDKINNEVFLVHHEGHLLASQDLKDAIKSALQLTCRHIFRLNHRNKTKKCHYCNHTQKLDR